MENRIEIFKNEEFGEIRTVVIDNEPWFVGKDVASVLGYKDTSDALKRHVDVDDKLTRRFTDSGQEREMYIINESGLYSLVLSSKLESAKAFKRWVTHEVIPSIRKHGDENKTTRKVVSMENPTNMNVITIDGVECYELNGTAYLKLETVARGLGFTREKNGTEYIMWDRVRKYLEELSFHTSVESGFPEFIPENIFYRLAMKAKNEVAEAFQAKVADEIIPSIRKHGGYITGQETLSDEEFLAKAVLMAQSVIAEKEARLAAAEAKNEELTQSLTIKDQQIMEMQPKVSYYEIVLRCKDLLPISTIAKDYGWSGKKMNQHLHDKGVQYKQGSIWLLYQKYAEMGYTSTKTNMYVDDNGEEHMKVSTYWTQKGRLFLYDLLKTDGILPLIEQKSA